MLFSELARVRAGEVVGRRGIGGDVLRPSEARFAAPEIPTDAHQRRLVRNGTWAQTWNSPGSAGAVAAADSA